MWTGRLGEDEAARYLGEQGLVLVARNYRAERGEVDLVMRDGPTLVFVEVRTRSDPSRGSALETIDGRKRARIVAAARAYLDEHPFAGPVRFDVVGITGVGPEQQLEHVADAFEVGE